MLRRAPRLAGLAPLTPFPPVQFSAIKGADARVAPLVLVKPDPSPVQVSQTNMQPFFASIGFRNRNRCRTGADYATGAARNSSFPLFAWCAKVLFLSVQLSAS